MFLFRSERQTTHSRPSGFRRSIATLFLFLPILLNQGLVPSTSSSLKTRRGSPPSGCSILITSAPNCLRYGYKYAHWTANQDVLTQAVVLQRALQRVVLVPKYECHLKALRRNGRTALKAFFCYRSQKISRESNEPYRLERPLGILFNSIL